MAWNIISTTHKHRFSLSRVIRSFNGRANQLQFRCLICHMPYETTNRAIWHPSKLVPLTERTADYLAERSEFSREQLLEMLGEQLAIGKTAVYVNIERQLDGTWTNVPYTP